MNARHHHMRIAVSSAFMWGIAGAVSASDLRTCPTEPGPGALIIEGAGGGMNGYGWDGEGENATAVLFHVEGTTADLGGGQRAALIAGMQAWANVARITFVELPIPNRQRQLDFNFLVGDHCFLEPAECNDGDCYFDGPGGTLAHAAFPAGEDSICIEDIPESFAGNVHFDDDDLWEQDNGSPTNFSLTLVACHEIGHAIGLIHSGGGNDVMRPSFAPGDNFSGLTQNDIDNIRIGYAAGPGAVITLEQTGVWVNNGFGGDEQGIQSNPFNSVAEGVSGVPPFGAGVTLHVNAGNYFEVLTITQNMVMQAENGLVRIGVPAP